MKKSPEQKELELASLRWTGDSLQRSRFSRTARGKFCQDGRPEPAPETVSSGTRKNVC